MRRTMCLMVGIGATAVTAAAGAGGLTMTFTGEAAGLPIAVHHDASAAWDADRVTVFAAPAFAGARVFSDTGRTFRTFATRLVDSFALGETVAYAQVDPSEIPGGDPTGSPTGQVRAELLADLYGRYWGFAATDADPTFVAGFQLAIWEIMHENLTGFSREDAAARLMLDVGAFQSDYESDPGSFTAYIHANMMLASLANGPSMPLTTLRGWTESGFRDQLAAVVVPLPAPALLAAAGLLAVRSRRRDR